MCSEQYIYQTISDVYSTRAATTTVKIRPGTRPSTEYDHGNDMIARHMYSENSRAAVYVHTVSVLLQHNDSPAHCLWKGSQDLR